MQVHHLNCGTMCPLGGRLGTGRSHMVCHCLLIESDAGLILVDSGLGLTDIAQRQRLGLPFRAIVRPQLQEDETAIRQVQGLGFKPEDVRHIIVTHLDLDHAGGLPDFPQAKVHVFDDELEAALHPSGAERHRYIPGHWSHDVNWQRYSPQGEPWFELPTVRALVGLNENILLIPLAGHTRGHVGVAVNTEAGWLLHAGDAYFHSASLLADGKAPLGIRIFETSLAVNNAQRKSNLEKLVTLHKDHPEIHIVSAHDVDEFSACQPKSD